MNGRLYSATFTAVAVTAAQDFFEVVPADDKPIDIVGFELGQYSDAGDAQDELLSIAVVRGHTTSGSGGGAFTPLPVAMSDTAFGGTCEINNTTIASAGTGITLWTGSFNVRAGIEKWFPPDNYLPCSQASGVIIVLRLLGAPADSLTMNGTLYFKEYC